MSVVKTDWMDPASWLKTRVSYGFLKDGETLRFCRTGKASKQSFFQCSVQEWQACPDFRKQLEAERTGGARLIAGLEPHRVMIRSLESPLKDKAKSAEIWGTLLDAAIPFPLEKCQVAFLPAPSLAQEKLRCLAVAARLEDLQEVLSEWQLLGLEPDLIFPEELMIPRQEKNPLWLGQTRTVFCVWKDGIFSGGGGALSPEQRSRQLARFSQSINPDTGAPEWHECGPGTDSEPCILEQNLAIAGLKTGVLHANLRAEPLAAPELLKIYERKKKTLKTALLIFLMLLFFFPLLLRQQLRVYQTFLRSEIDSVYQRYTGQRSNAPGQEMLLANRYQKENWAPLWSKVQELSRPAVSTAFLEISLAAQNSGVVFTRVDLGASRLDLHLLGSEENVTSFITRLHNSGWVLKRAPGVDGTWHVQGEKSP